jgi:hypothetical protein
MVVVLFLAGCGADIDRHVTFYRDEAWRAEMEIAFPVEMLALLASSPESFEADIAKQVADWEADGAQVNWNSRRQETTLIYTFNIEGEGLELLNTIAFEGDATLTAMEINGQRQIQFSYFSSGDLTGANTNTVTLQGGDILSSNGTEIDKGTVQWVNANGRMEAVLTEKSGSGLGMLLIGLLLAGSMGGAGWYFWKQRQQTPVQMQPTAMAFCAHCGTTLSPQAKFCPNCGQPQP